MKLFWILILSGLSLSAISAFFSISGLTVLFSGATIAIAIYASILEVVKLAAVSWTYRRWNVISFKIKSFLIFAIIVLMMISSLGVFGYLSKAYLEKQNPNKDLETKITQIEVKLLSEQELIKRDQLVINQLNAQVNSLVSGDKVEKSIIARSRQSKERNSIEADIKSKYKNIDELNNQKNVLQLEQNKTAAEVGPLKYVAKLISPDGDLDSAVRILISFLVIVTDPLAVIILLCANKEKMLREEEKEILKNEAESEEEPEILADTPEPVVEKIIPIIIQEAVETAQIPVIIEPVIEVSPEVVPKPLNESQTVSYHDEQTKHIDYQFQHEIRHV